VSQQTKDDKVPMFRGYECVQMAHFFWRKTILCNPALASAELCVGVARDNDKISGPSEAMLFGKKLCNASQCVIFKARCQGMCFMTWSVTDACLSEQGLLGQHWTQ